METLSRQTYVLIVIQIPTRITAKTANIILNAMRPVLEMLTAQVRFLVPTVFLCVIFSIVNQYFPYHFYTWEKYMGKRSTLAMGRFSSHPLDRKHYFNEVCTFWKQGA